MDNNSKLYALFQNAPLSGVSKVKLAVIGKWKGHPAGEFSLTIDDLERIKNNFDNAKALLPVDYEHQTLTGKEAPAAGWIKSLSVEQGELIAEIEWLDKAKEQIKSKAYRYISPVFAANSIDQITGANLGWSLHSAGLTNKPFLEELGELNVNKKPNDTSHKNKEEIEMDKEKEEALNAQIVALKAKNEALEKAEAEREKAEAEALTKNAEKVVSDLIANKKIDEKVKEQALAFAKIDAEGLKALISGVLNGDKKAPENDLYANKNNPTDAKDYVDLAKLI